MNDNEAQLSELAKALGHPARIKILNFLARQKHCVCSPIVDEIGLAQSTVSQHLKILKESGWIQGSISGNKVCYCINPETVEFYQENIVTFLNALKGEAHE